MGLTAQREKTPTGVLLEHNHTVVVKLLLTATSRSLLEDLHTALLQNNKCYSATEDIKNSIIPNNTRISAFFQHASLKRMTSSLSVPRTIKHLCAYCILYNSRKKQPSNPFFVLFCFFFSTVLKRNHNISVYFSPKSSKTKQKKHPAAHFLWLILFVLWKVLTI